MPVNSLMTFIPTLEFASHMRVAIGENVPQGIYDIRVGVRTAGGRTFKLFDFTEITLHELISHLQTLGTTELAKCKTITEKEEVKGKIQAATRAVRDLHYKSETYLQYSPEVGRIQRILTATGRVFHALITWLLSRTYSSHETRLLALATLNRPMDPVVELPKVLAQMQEVDASLDHVEVSQLQALYRRLTPIIDQYNALLTGFDNVQIPEDLKEVIQKSWNLYERFFDLLGDEYSDVPEEYKEFMLHMSKIPVHFLQRVSATDIETMRLRIRLKLYQLQATYRALSKEERLHENSTFYEKLKSLGLDVKSYLVEIRKRINLSEPSLDSTKGAYADFIIEIHQSSGLDSRSAVFKEEEEIRKIVFNET